MLKNAGGYVITTVTTPVAVAAGVQNQPLLVVGAGTYTITTPFDVVTAPNGFSIFGTPRYSIVPANGGADVTGNVSNLVNNVPANGSGTCNLGNGVAITPAGNYKITIIVVIKGHGTNNNITQSISTGWKSVVVAMKQAE